MLGTDTLGVRAYHRGNVYLTLGFTVLLRLTGGLIARIRISSAQNHLSKYRMVD